jgi:hypothetical protein
MKAIKIREFGSGTGLTNGPERQAAINNGDKFYFPPKPCRNGHLSKRYTAGAVCHECAQTRLYKNPSDVISAGTNERSIKTLVYVVEAGMYVKIGIAENIATRFQVLRTHCPIPARLAYTTISMARPHAKKIEERCHFNFKDSHSHGEWFEVGTDDVINFIKTMEPMRNEVAEVDPRQIGLAID